jgi:hypothetical protein
MNKSKFDVGVLVQVVAGLGLLAYLVAKSMGKL